MKVGHPILMLVIWFGLGWLAYSYGLLTVAEGIVFCFGAVGLYTVIVKHFRI